MSSKSTIKFENATLMFRNFSGKAGEYNPAGRRNFCVLVDDDFAKELAKDGWNVRMLTPKDDADAPQPYLPVAVTFNKYPPKIIVIRNGIKTAIKEEDVHILDWAEFETVDLILSPYNWTVQGKSGVKAYLKTMYAVVIPDEFAEKYQDVPDSAESACLNGECDLPF